MTKTQQYGALLIAVGAIAMIVFRRGAKAGASQTNINDSSMSKTYFTIAELCASSTAKKKGIDNTPSAEVVEKLQALIDNVLNPARIAYGKPIYVNSGYRSEKLNAIVGGASNSQHLTGEAADVTTGSVSGNRKLFAIFAELGNYDQLIWEKGGEWIHVSYRDGNNRGTMLSYNGSTYTNINNDWQIIIV